MEDEGRRPNHIVSSAIAPARKVRGGRDLARYAATTAIGSSTLSTAALVTPEGNRRPSSPRDTTKITMSGVEVKRETIPDIVDKNRSPESPKSVERPAISSNIPEPIVTNISVEPVSVNNSAEPITILNRDPTPKTASREPTPKITSRAPTPRRPSPISTTNREIAAPIVPVVPSSNQDLPQPVTSTTSQEEPSTRPAESPSRESPSKVSRPRSPRDAVPNLINVVNVSPRGPPPVVDINSYGSDNPEVRSEEVISEPMRRSSGRSVFIPNVPIIPPISPESVSISSMSPARNPPLGVPLINNRRQSPRIVDTSEEPTNRLRSPGSGRPATDPNRPHSRSPREETTDRRAEASTVLFRMPGTILADEKYLEYDNLPPRKQSQIKDEYRIRFDMIKNANRSINIPAIDQLDCLSNIVRRYDQTVRYIMICGKANTYRIALVVYWLGLEALAIRVFGLNASGFTIFQFRAMNQYDSFLIELGEKNMDSRFDSWPVEIKIIILGLVHLVIFIVAQVFASWIGPTMAPTIIGILQQVLTGPTVDSNGVPSSGGFDVASLIANLGTAFVGTQPQPAPAAAGTEGLNNSRREFRPRFDE